jgi:hypothetical protein
MFQSRKEELTSREAELTEALTSSNLEWARLDIKGLGPLGDKGCR